MEMTLENSVAFVLCVMEIYHIMGHLAILCRVRLLPRKDLVRLRVYFLIDALTVFSSSILFTGKMRWLAILQIIQHMYYFLFWEQTGPAKKIVSWSSLDWLRSSRQNDWELDLILGTLFDVVVHAIMAYYLAMYLSLVQIIVCFTIVQVPLLLVMLSGRYAWASPWRVPKWVEKRIEPLKENEKGSH